MTLGQPLDIGSRALHSVRGALVLALQAGGYAIAAIYNNASFSICSTLTWRTSVPFTR